MSEYVPEYTAESMKECHLTGPDLDGWFDALRYAILSTDAEIIEDCPSGGEGLASLLKTSAASSDSWTDLVKHIKSRRYTYTQAFKALEMQLVLGITRSRYDMGAPGYIRVLGFNDRGRELLAEIRDEESASLPVIINVNKSADSLNKESQELLKLDMHAADIYNHHKRGDEVLK